MLLSKRKNREIFDGLFIAAAVDTLKPESMAAVDRLFRENLIIRNKDDIKNMCLCYIIQASYLAVEAQGRLYGHHFDEMEQLNNVFIALMHSFIFDSEINKEHLEKFQKLFGELRSKSEAPFIGCLACDKVCLYRHESSSFLNDTGINADFNYITTKIDDDNHMWIELAKLCHTVSKRLVPFSSSRLAKGVALCYLSQKVAQSGYPPIIQSKVARNINTIYETGIVKL
jgi:hypothetical protein